MKQHSFMAVFLAYYLFSCGSSFAYVIAARENAWMKYAKNRYERGGGEYEFRYDIHERAKMVTRTEVRNIRTGEIAPDDTPYQIVAIQTDPATGGTILKAIGEPQPGISEMLVIGGDFVLTAASTDRTVRVADLERSDSVFVEETAGDEAAPAVVVEGGGI